ncbi:MAG TPA: TolC family protein, partial [Lacipirellulaceae bacterium]|nr:TolC family protein [Lacipirellulaceae bacterium]
MRVLIAFLIVVSKFASAADLPPPTNVSNRVAVTTELIHRLALEARTNNPSFRAAGSRLKAAELNADTVRTWEDPMGRLGGEGFTARGMDPAQMGDLLYGVEEKLPLWGKPRAARKFAEKDVAIREAEADLRFHELVRDITKGLLMAALAERVVEIGAQDLTWLQITAKTTEDRYRAGQAALADVLQIQNELAKR